ncbi:hypothetical protein BN1723_000384 [Verticillium longisporum]|uniref:Protein kinase domain-containing protein n=1 Tax=Verticillium longisporum TaxID=100787 RepID=A0A0G4LKM4_VERLO|nr:hypothetical protein BN1723_000384 [Verticillium longisporum]CRK22479.1 hypothetical protein BN1708_013422 [Verticillium longisporum]
MSTRLENARSFLGISGYEQADSTSSSETNKDQNDLPRIISVNEVFKENASNEPVFDRTAVIAMRDDQVYYAAVLTRADKVDKQAIYSSLELVPPKKIYPAHEPELTRAPGLYIKTPQLSTYSPDSENVIASQTLNEAKIYEILRKNPHPALGTCLGCLVSDDGLVTGLELVRYEKTLFQRAHDPAFYEGDTRVKTMKTVKEAVCHLHKLGLAHNDLSPLNIMFGRGSSDEPVVLDFDTCHPEGTKLAKGGIVGDWEGTSIKKFDVSSFECDFQALFYLEEWLSRQQKALMR